MNSSNQTVVAIPIITVKKYYLDDRLIDFCANDDISYCWKCVVICFLTFYILQAEALQKSRGLG